MSMKLSYRDKVIAVVAICVLVIIAGIVMFIKPRMAELDTAKINLQNVQKEKERVDAKINTLDGLLVTLKDTAAEIEDVQKNFYTEVAPFEFEQRVREILLANNLDFTNISTTYASAEDIALYQVKPGHVLAYNMKIKGDIYNELPQEVYDAYNGISVPEGEKVKVGLTTMTVCFNAKPGFEAALKCLDDIAADDKSIIVTLTEGSKVEDDDEVILKENIIVINVYSIVPMNTEMVKADNGAVVIE